MMMDDGWNIKRKEICLCLLSFGVLVCDSRYPGNVTVIHVQPHGSKTVRRVS